MEHQKLQHVQEVMISPITNPCVGSVNAETLYSTHDYYYWIHVKEAQIFHLNFFFLRQDRNKIFICPYIINL